MSGRRRNLRQHRFEVKYGHDETIEDWRAAAPSGLASISRYIAEAIEIRLNRDKDIVDAGWRSDSADKENCIALNKEVFCLPRQGH
jgi:hypothetical protein